MSWRTTRATDAGAPGHHQVAIIDLGSNSWRLVVFSYGQGPWWKRTDELYETVRIGAGLESTGELGEDAMARGLETLSVFGRFCRANRIAPADVHPVATSAIRDAANGAAFLAEAERAGAMEIEVLSAADEAHYGYVAAVNTTTLRDGVVLDIGGGSLQLTSVADRRAGPSASFPLGAVRITEQFLSDGRPAKKKELARVRAHVTKALKTLDWVADSGARLVGMGGAVRNLAAAVQGIDGGVDLGVQGFVIEPDALSELVGRLAALSPEQRGSIPGIKPGRGDIILASALVLEAVVERGGFCRDRGHRGRAARGPVPGPDTAGRIRAAVRGCPCRRRAQPRDSVRVRSRPRRTRRHARAADVRLARRRRHVHPRRGRARAAVGGVDAARRRDDHLL